MTACIKEAGEVALIAVLIFYACCFFWICRIMGLSLEDDF